MLRKLFAGLLVLMGVSALVAMRSVDEFSPLVFWMRALSLLSFAGAAVMFFMPERARQAAEGTDAPAAIIPRTLPRDPLNDPASTDALPKRIETAITLSKVHSRSVGVVCLRIDGYSAFVQSVGGERAETMVQAAVAAMRNRLRNTDRPLVNGKGEFLVCLPLISVRRDLESVAARMLKATEDVLAAEAAKAGEPAPAVDLGVAMYPIGGYSGEDLIESAQADCRATRAKRLGRPAKIVASGAAPVMPKVKPARSRRANRSA